MLFKLSVREDQLNFPIHHRLVICKIQNEIKDMLGWVWQHTSVIPVVGRLRQEEQEFQASVSYMKKEKKKKRHEKYKFNLIINSTDIL
jgi:hypothetical protein